MTMDATEIGLVRKTFEAALAAGADDFLTKPVEMAGVLAYRLDRSRARLIFHTKPDSYNIRARIAFLTDYQSAAYAARYRTRVENVRVA